MRYRVGWTAVPTSWPMQSLFTRRCLMRWQIPLVALLALFVAVSCDQQPLEPPADQVAEAPAFNFTNGPANPGPYIERGTGGWVTWWDFPPATTPDGEWWTVLEGIDHTDNMFRCNGNGTSTRISWQDIVKEGSIASLQMRHKSPAHAFHSDDFYDEFGEAIFCGIMPLAIASGTGSTVWLDNDLTGRITNNVYGGYLNAWLRDVATGEKYHATYTINMQWRPDDVFFRVLTEKMHIK